MKRALFVAAVLTTALAITAPADAAVDRSCVYTGTVGTDGVVHAFGWCEYDENGSVASGRGPQLSTRAVPNFVQVLDVADDGSRMWVLTADQTAHGTFLTAYDRSGRAVGRRRVGNVASDGSLIARGGEYWAVYTQVRAYQGRSVSVLFQTKTIGTDVAPTQITGPSEASDVSPVLAFRPGGGVVLAWARYAQTTSSARIRLASSTDGRWSSRDFVAGTRVVMATAGSMTVVAWEDTDGVRIADTGTTGRDPLRGRLFASDNRAIEDLLDVATDGRTAAVHMRGSDGVYRLGRRQADGSYRSTTPSLRTGRHGSLLIRSGVPLLLTGTADNRAYADPLR
ncbi:MAG: hypothetical protein QOE05_476 [Actinomycetota bacterium]|jgi:hypothetical protein|nr:hypothetical protein [Actinomycetota bacterium]